MDKVSTIYLTPQLFSEMWNWCAILYKKLSLLYVVAMF